MPSQAGNPGEYENYNRTASSYDRGRIPSGVEIALGCFASNRRALTTQSILDAGCGSGNYLAAFCGKVGHLVGIDANEEMLAVARDKFDDEPQVRLEKSSLIELPFDAKSFDGVMCNQVIHHLETEHTRVDFSHLRMVVEQIYRVLRPGGVVVFNTCTQRQLRDGYWWAELIPTATDRIAQRYIPIHRFDQLLAHVGLELGGVSAPVTDLLWDKAVYFDPASPLKQEFRDSDSTWTLCPVDELQRALGRVEEMIEKGVAERHIAQRDDLRQAVGQTVVVFAKKAT